MGLLAGSDLKEIVKSAHYCNYPQGPHVISSPPTKGPAIPTVKESFQVDNSLRLHQVYYSKFIGYVIWYWPKHFCFYREHQVNFLWQQDEHQHLSYIHTSVSNDAFFVKWRSL